MAACGGGGKPSEQQPAPAGAEFESSLTGLSRTYEGDHDLSVEATKAALKRLGLNVTDESGGVFKKTLDAESQDGTSVVVQLAGLSKGSTRISVKVGYLLGDRDAAQRIHSEVEAELEARRGAVREMQRKWGGGAGPTTTTLPGRPGTAS